MATTKKISDNDEDELISNELKGNLSNEDSTDFSLLSSGSETGSPTTEEVTDGLQITDDENKTITTTFKGKRTLNVLLLGSSSVGKTSLIQRLVYGEAQPLQTPTLDIAALTTQRRLGGKMYTLNVYDTVGQERFRSLVHSLYRKIDLAVLVFAVDDLTSLHDLRFWLQEVQTYAPVDEGGRFPILILGNKCEIPPEQRKVTQKSAKIWCVANGDYPYLETSAVTGYNVDDAFREAMKLWNKQFKKTLRAKTKTTLRLKQAKSEPTSKCPNCTVM